jgi:hypothetical protein
MDKALDGTQQHMQLGTAKIAVTLGHSGQPDVKQVAVSPHNVGKTICNNIWMIDDHFVALSFLSIQNRTA